MKSGKRVDELTVLMRGAGEMASGVAHRLHRSHFEICMLEIPNPLAVRREVSFCEAVYEGEKEIEGVWAKYISNPKRFRRLGRAGGFPYW
jgi:xanthine dehydrogenase accessory factor